MVETTKVLLWPSEGKYTRFREVCDDDQPISYADFVAKCRANLARLGIDELQYTKIDPDPDKLAIWCMANVGRVDANARARYIALRAFLD